MPRDARTRHREEFEVLERYLTENGLKRSRQREVILDRFLEAEGHMTVDDVCRVVRRSHPEIGRTTIYRTLKLLCDAELADAIQLSDGLTRFERLHRNDHHDHIVCTGCGAILEFTSAEIERLQREIAAAHGFSVDSHRHHIFGLCPSCGQKRDERLTPRPRRSYRRGPRRPPRADATYPLS